MQHVRFLLAMALSAGQCVLPALAGDMASGDITPARTLKVVNATYDSATAMAVSPAGEDHFVDVVLGEPLRGGLADTTVRLPAGSCLRDVRVTFRPGHTTTFANVDVCRITGLRLAPSRAVRNDEAFSRPSKG